MAGPLSTEDVVSAALKGLAVAQKEYENWSEEWLWSAPEYFSTVFVAKEIGKLTSAKFITLENSASSAIEEAGAKGRGKLHSLIRANGRFDILLWWGNRTPRAPIEVKCQVLNFEKIRADVERISKVVHRNKVKSTIGFGAVVFYASCTNDKTFTAKEKLVKSMANILHDAKELVGDSCIVNFSQTKIKTVADSAWVGCVLLIKPKMSE
jgi:hypothetical protein